MPNNFHHKLIDLLKLVREPLRQSKNARRCGRELQSNRPIRKRARKTRKLLAELLDKSQLYVHLSAIDDQNLKVSLKYKAINREFYDEQTTLTFSR